MFARNCLKLAAIAVGCAFVVDSGIQPVSAVDQPPPAALVVPAVHASPAAQIVLAPDQAAVIESDADLVLGHPGQADPAALGFDSGDLDLDDLTGR